MGRKPFKDPRDVRLHTFAMRVNSEERQMLAALAKRLQRTRSDVVRLLVREAVRQLAKAVECRPNDDREDKQNVR